MLTERKGIKKVISVSQKLLEEGFNVKTLLVGDAHGENIYKKFISIYQAAKEKKCHNNI